MRIILIALAGVFCLLSANTVFADIKIYDNSTKFNFPYKTDDKKINMLKSNLNLIKPNLSYLEVINLIGEPDIIDDLDKEFFGLSPREDSFTLANRQYIKYRAIWYLEKKGEGINLNDVWLVVYIGRDENTVLNVLTNKIISGDDSF